MLDYDLGTRVVFVAPRVGAWIEIVMATSILGFDGVAPRVGRGLKSTIKRNITQAGEVAPRVGGVD